MFDTVMCFLYGLLLVAQSAFLSFIVVRWLANKFPALKADKS
jgi:hypothetical protein